MGNAGSAHAQASLRVVAAVSGTAPVPLDAAEWQQLLSYATPLSRFDPGEVEREIRPHCAELVYNSSQTLNLQRFIVLVAQQLRKARRQGGGSTAVGNAVYCLRTIIKDLMEQLNSEQLLAFIELPPEVAAAAAAAAVAGTEQPQQQQAAVAEGGGGGSSGGNTPTSSSGGGSQAEFAGLHNGSLVQTLVRAAMQTLSDSNLLSTGGYTLLLECSQLLMVLGSSALYCSTARGQLGQHPYLDAAMQQKDLANTVVESLLRYFITAPPVPLSQKIYRYMPTDTRSVLKIVRTAAASVFWLPYQAYSLLVRPGRQPSGVDAGGSGGTAGAPSSSPLGDSALLLLLVLLFHSPPQDAPFGNPYRQSLQRLQDADDLVTEQAAEDGRAAMSGDAAISYAALYEALGSSLTSERAVLLLYALLHGRSHFQEYCLVRSDLDTMLLPLLELLYSAHERTPNQMYMLLIILLMLSQDSAFAQNIHRIRLPAVPFYKERSTATTLGSLLVVLLLRTAHYNLAKLRDVYLHTNTLAALANLAPHMAGACCLSTHAAQRLVSLFHLLARRYNRLQAAAEGADVPPTPTADASALSPLTPWTPAGGPATAATATSQQQSGAEQQQQVQRQQTPEPPQAQQQQQQQQQQTPEQRELELQLYADFLRIVLEIVNSILTSALPQNPELVYTLLHRQEVFAPFLSHPRYSELMDNIQRVTDYFNRRVEESVAASGGAQQLSAERVLDLIKQHSRGWRRDRLKPFPELRFTYEEEASPEEFFVPYVWSLAVAQAGIPWRLSAITLFTPTVVPVGESEEAAVPSTQATLSEADSLPAGLAGGLPASGDQPSAV